VKAQLCFHGDKFVSAKPAPAQVSSADRNRPDENDKDKRAGTLETNGFSAGHYGANTAVVLYFTTITTRIDM